MSRFVKNSFPFCLLNKKNISIIFLFAFSLYPIFYILHSSPIANASFTGPGVCTPPNCGGKFSVDTAGNIGFGTNNSSATPVSTFSSSDTESGSASHGYVFMVASTTNPGIGLKNTTAKSTFLWSLRNFGNLQLYRETDSGFQGGSALPGLVVLDINAFGDIAIGVRATSTSGSNPARLQVDNAIKAGGGFIGSGSSLTGVTASQVAAGAFVSSNYAFPSSLAVGTSTVLSLPQTLSVYGSGYFQNNVGIGTTTPATVLVVLGSSTIMGTNAGTKNVISGGTAALLNLNLGISTDAPIMRLINSANSANQTASLYLAHDSGGAGGTSRDYGAIKSKLLTGAASSTLSFWNYGAGALTERMTINEFGYIGIGTTTPTTAMVLASGQFSYPLGSVSLPSITFLNDTNNGIWSSAADTINFSTGGSERMRIMSSGNVSIGTTTDVKELNVVSTAAGNGIFLVGLGSNSPAYSLASSTATTDSNLGLALANGHFSSQSLIGDTVLRSKNGKLLLMTGTTVAGLTLDTSNNVGIATTTPNYTLSVNGTANFNNNVVSGIAAPISDGDATNKAYVNTNFAPLGGSSGVWILSGSNLYASSTSWNVGIGTTTPGFLFTIATSTPTPYFIVKSDGNIGIGTTTPSTIMVLNSGQFSYPLGSVSLPSITFLNDTNNGIWSSAADTINFSTAGSEVMRINSNGNIGIGTTNPVGLLQASSSSFIVTYAGNVGIATATPVAILHVLQTAAANAFRVDDVAGDTSPFLIDQNGNVGIATTTPNYALDVVGGAQFSQPIIVGTPTANSHAATKSYVDSVSTGASGVWLLSGSNLYASSTSWNVGIGTTTPTAFLHLSTTANQDLLRVDDNGAGDTSPFVVKANGNVGIGTTAANTVLDVILQNTATSTVTTNARFGHLLTANTAAAGIGVGFDFVAPDDASTTVTLGNHQMITTDVTAGSLNAYHRFTAVNDGTNKEVMRLTDAGLMGISGIANAGLNPTANLNIAGGTTRSGGSGLTNGWFLVNAGTYTDDTTAGTSTATKFAFNTLQQPTLAATNPNVTTTDAATFYIANSATSGTNMAITRPWALWIDDGDIRVDGNIGIGATTLSGQIPNANLYIKGAISFEETVSASEGAVPAITQGSVSNPGTTNDLLIGTRSGSGQIMFYTGNAGSGGNFGSTTNALRMNIKADGNVGIATTTPSYTLDVVGTAQFSQPVIVGTPTTGSHATTKSYVDTNFAPLGGSSGVWLLSGSNLYASSTSWNVGIGTTTPKSLFTIATSSGVPYFVVKSWGNIGIGTSSPAYKLDVLGSTRIKGLSYLMGNVGIGLTNPQANLDILGSVKVSFANYKYTAGASQATSTGSPRCSCDTNSDAEECGGSYYTNTDEGATCYDLYLDHGDQSKKNSPFISIAHAVVNTPSQIPYTRSNISGSVFTIDSSQNVGIGTSTPGYLLTVATSSPTPFFIIQASNGNVAIATTTFTEVLSVAGNIYTTGTIKTANSCGIPNGIFTFERGTATTNTALTQGNGVSVQGNVAACSGIVTAIGGISSAASSTAYSPLNLWINGSVPATTCNTGNIVSSNVGTSTVCTTTFAKNNLIGCAFGTVTSTQGTTSNYRCVLYLRFD